jgi:RNA polymerase sigma factor (sigma-70 family)
MSEAALPGFSRLLSDDRLTRRAVGGDERAFAAIFRRYHQSLYRFCLAIVGNPEDAQDALQNTMIKVLRALPGEERKIDLKPWLYRIAHNESIDLLRRRRETRQLDVEQIAPGYGLAEDVATRERLRGLIVDLRELPERQREVLVMRELAGLDFEEIGTALDTSGAVARQTLYEARQSLRQMEEGREMSCASVTKALSDGDGRVTRRRDVRAHLRSCSGCRSFGEEIKRRQHDLAALSPLPAAAAVGMLHGLVSSQGAAGGGLAATLGGGAAKTLGASAAAKSVATVAVVATIGVTAADQSGVIHLGLPGEQREKPAASPSDRGAAGAGVGAAAVEGRHVAGPGGGASDGGERGVAGSGQQGAAGGKEAGTAMSPQDGAALGGKAHPQPVPHEEVESKAQGPETDHPQGQGHEKEHPEAAAVGEETAQIRKPEVPDGDEAAELDAPSKPQSPPDVPEPESQPHEPKAATPPVAPAPAPAPQTQPSGQPLETEDVGAERGSGAADTGRDKAAEKHS